jgi:hypothetical protein
VFEKSDWKQRQKAATGQGTVRKFAFRDEILREKEKSLSRQTSMLDSFKSPSVLVHRHPHCWTVAAMIQLTVLQLKTECPLLKLLFVCHFVFCL